MHAFLICWVCELCWLHDCIINNSICAKGSGEIGLMLRLLVVGVTFTPGFVQMVERELLSNYLYIYSANRTVLLSRPTL